MLKTVTEVCRLWVASLRTRWEMRQRNNELRRQQLPVDSAILRLTIEWVREGNLWGVYVHQNGRRLTDMLLQSDVIYPEIACEIIQNSAEALALLPITSKQISRVLVDCKIPMTLMWKMAEACTDEGCKSSVGAMRAALFKLLDKNAMTVFRPRLWPF